MVKGLAHIFKGQLVTIPFIDKLAGLVYVAEYTDTTFDETGEIPTTIVKRIPVACDIEVDTCDQKDLVPDSSKKGILYFEDLGTNFVGKEKKMNLYRSRLRLVAWINTSWIKNNTCVDAAGILINRCIKQIEKLDLQNVGEYLRIRPRVESIPKQDKNIFNLYTYDIYTGYVLPPYEFFAIDFSIEYLIRQSCFDELEMKTEEEMNIESNCISS